MNSQLDDSVSGAIKRFTDILLFHNSFGTVMGGLFGVVLHYSIIILSNYFSYLKNFISSIYYFIAFGIFCFNIEYFLNYRKAIPIDVEKELKKSYDFIDEKLRNGEINTFQAKQYKQLILKKILDNMVVNIEKISSRKEYNG